jgi:pantothenate kinase
MQIKEMTKTTKNRLPPEKYEELVKKLRKEHEKPCKGMFEFLDAQGGWLDFVYRFFKDDPIYTIRLTHGEVCELPMGIVKHLNNTKKKIRTMANTELKAGVRGVPTTYDVQSRIRFTPMDVM